MSRIMHMAFIAALIVSVCLGSVIVVGQLIGVATFSGAVVSAAGKLTKWATYGFSLTGILGFLLVYVDKVKVTE